MGTRYLLAIKLHQATTCHVPVIDISALPKIAGDGGTRYTRICIRRPHHPRPNSTLTFSPDAIRTQNLISKCTRYPPLHMKCVACRPGPHQWVFTSCIRCATSHETSTAPSRKHHGPHRATYPPTKTRENSSHSNGSHLMHDAKS